MTVSSASLVKDLQGQVRELEADLRKQVGHLPDLSARLREDFAAAQRTERTAESWTSWLDAQATQAAVSWVLGCVFIRFCEDNDLTDRRWIAGLRDARGDGLARAVDAQAAWILANPRKNERGWLRQAFTWLRGTRAGSSLLPDSEFVWWWDVSADAAEALLGFFRRRDSEGTLTHRFDSPDSDTRFSATSTRTCPKLRVSGMRCCRHRSSWRSSSSTSHSIRRWTGSASTDSG